jgi:hypothetical protein
MMGAVHVLPGTTFSNVKVRGDYDAEGRAIFTLRELEAWLTVQIAGAYHHRIHTTLLRPPLTVWRDLQGEVDFDLPPTVWRSEPHSFPRLGAGWRKTAFTSRKSATGQTPCHERLGEEVSCWSNTIHVIFPASSCASRVDASSKRGTATSLIRP